MWHWNWRATLLVVGLSGVVTVFLNDLILGYGSEGLFSYQVEPEILSWSALPTAVFVAASLVRRKSLACKGW
jgi:hypothetical protein